MNAAISDIGFFHLELHIGDDAPGAPRFQVTLGINVTDRRVSGPGRITQDAYPPLEVRIELNGSFTFITTVPKRTYTLVVASGYPAVHMPPIFGPGPALTPNVELRLILDETWSAGSASYRYQDAPGRWIEVKEVPVRAERASL